MQTSDFSEAALMSLLPADLADGLLVLPIASFGGIASLNEAVVDAGLA